MSRNVIDLRSRKPERTQSARKSAKRRSPLRAQRRKRRAFFLFALLLIAVGAASGVSALSYLPRLSVNAVNVTGAESVPPNLIRAQVESALRDGSRGFLSRENIFLFPKNDIERSLLSKEPRIRAARIERTALLSQAVRVTVEERKAKAKWCDADQCYLMDDAGFLFDTATSSDGLIEFRGSIEGGTLPIGQSFQKGNISRMYEFIDALKGKNFATTGVRVLDDGDYVVELAEGFSIKTSLAEEAKATLDNLGLVLSGSSLKGKESALEYIDLRFGNRVYYKLKGSHVSEVPS